MRAKVTTLFYDRDKELRYVGEVIDIDEARAAELAARGLVELPGKGKARPAAKAAKGKR